MACLCSADSAIARLLLCLLQQQPVSPFPYSNGGPRRSTDVCVCVRVCVHGRGARSTQRYVGAREASVVDVATNPLHLHQWLGQSFIRPGGRLAGEADMHSGKYGKDGKSLVTGGPSHGGLG